MVNGEEDAMQHGKFQGRIEDARFVTGRGVYVDDLTLDGMVHGALARAPMPGEIARVDVSAAREVPGVLGVWTAADLAAEGGPAHLPCGVALPGSDGETAFQAARPVLALGRARFTGEGVAFVVAETPAAAREAADLVEIELDGIGTVVEARDACANGAATVWDEVPDNIAFVWARGEMAAAEAAVAAAPRRVTLDSHISRVLAHSMEPRGCIGEVVEGRLVLHASNQSPHGLKGALAKVFGVGAADVRVIAPDVGGAFGMKAGVYVEDVLCLYAARALGRPVKWIADRTEGFLSDDHARDMAVRASLGFDDEGNLLGLTAHFDINIGAYLSGRSQGSMGNFGGLSGVYRIGPTAATAHGVFTHTHTTGAYRGAGRPEATYVIERLVDMAAVALGVDPFELRLRNLIPAEAMPHHTGFMFEYDCGEFAENMAQAAELSGRAGFAARKADAAVKGRLRGIGYANPIEVAGGPFVKPGTDHARVTVNADGTALIHAGCMSTGQGLQTMFCELVAEGLGIARADIRFAQGDTDDLPGGRGSGGSAATPTGGSSVTLAVRAVIDKGSELASEMLEAAVADIGFDAGEFGGVFQVAGTDRLVSLADVAAAAASKGEALAGQSVFTPAKVTFPNGCHVCEVEIDPETGQLEVCRYTVVEDVGRVMNLTMLTGQMHGGIAQGAGQSLIERMVHDRDGQPLSGSFMDYAMPRADMMPEIRFQTREVRTAVNPVGAKGVGEAGTVGSMVCVINAVCDALGVAHFEMPATPDRVWAALREARA